MAEQKQTEKSIFLAAVEIDSDSERAAYVERACAGNPQLRVEIDALLHAHAKPQPLLDASPTTGPTIGEQNTEVPGTVIGHYKLIEQIGEGGMGTVWMAQQQEPVKRVVAMKFIRAGMDSKQFIARFEAERQALALMDHANIAKVLDAGTTREGSMAEGQGTRANSDASRALDPRPSALDPSPGRPYFVMDLVKGVPITKYCDEHHLTPRQRLELFIPVCLAIQHAHQKGIIHRDLKPSNVLVALYDGRPVPKVIDFGVAKAAGQPLTDKTLVTGFGNIVGTLEYMSPEQAELNQLDIDTRSDIYALGVLLYELLAGSPPFTRKELDKAGMLEMLRVIREQEPSKPSTKLSTSEGLPTLAANRGTDPAKLTRLVRGELDWIVMKALEKDRNRRYETANGFAMDLQRYLADEPVQACPPSAGYRLRKFARRNRGPVLAATMLLLSLVAGIIGTTWQAVRAAQRAEGERLAKERAEANFALANEAVEKYLVTVTDDPDLKRADFNRLRKKLLESALPFFQRLTEQQSDDPKVEARRGHAYGRLAVVRRAMGENEAAMQDSDAARVIFARLTADFHTVSEYRDGLAANLTSVGDSLSHLGKRPEAEAVYRKALDIRKKLAEDFTAEPRYRQSLAEAQLALGILLCDLGQREEGEVLFRQAITIGQKLATEFPTVPRYREELAGAHNNLGVLLAELVGKSDEAATAYREALDIRAKLAADFPAEPEYRQGLAISHFNLGTLLEDLGEDEEAESPYRQAVAIQQKLADDFPTVPEYRQDLAITHRSLGYLLFHLGRHEDAVTASRQGVAIQERLATDFPTVPVYRHDLADGHNSLGNLLSDLGKRLEAEAAYRRAIVIKEELAAEFPAVPQDVVTLGGSYCNIGHLVRGGGHPQAALGWFEKAIATLEPVVATDPLLADAREFLRNSHWGRATALDDLGRHAEATGDWERALELDDGSAKATFRLRLSRNKNDAAGCLAAAAENEARNPTGPTEMYDAACNRAVCAAVMREDPKTPEADARRLAEEQADLAMAWLYKAVAAGFRNAEQMNQDKELDALRERDDFTKLLDELEAKEN